MSEPKKQVLSYKNEGLPAPCKYELEHISNNLVVLTDLNLGGKASLTNSICKDMIDGLVYLGFIDENMKIILVDSDNFACFYDKNNERFMPL